MGLCYITTKWTDKVWQGHVNRSPHAQHLVSQGKAKQSEYEGHAQDLHAALYLPNEPRKLDGAPEWASTMLEAAKDLTEWRQLKSRCRHSGLASGIATEAILDALRDQVPTDPNNKDNDEPLDLPYVPGGGQPGNGGGEPVAWTDATDEQKADIRRKVRMAIKDAREEVVKAEEMLDGVEGPLQLNRPGKEIGSPCTFEDLDHIREAYKAVENDSKLQLIAELAGRLVTKANTHKRTKVKGTFGEIKGIELSGDIPRVLPSELVGLRGGEMERLLTLSKIAGRKALSWQMKSEDSEARGPCIVLKDLSSSMRSDGRDTWASAVAMAILGTVTKQRRDWTMIGFDMSIRHEDNIKAGEGTIKDIQNALRHAPSGGTDYDPPVQRAVDIIRNSVTMRKADIIILTDGEADLSEHVAQQLEELTKTQGVQVYLIGIGHGAESIKQSDIAKVATEAVHLSTVNNESDTLFNAINLD